MSPDVLIIGAGPAGMSAALSLHTAGVKVQVVEEQATAGGQIYRAIGRSSCEQDDRLNWLGNDYARGQKLVEKFSEADIEVLFATSVWDISFNDSQVEVGLLTGDRAFYCHPRHIVLATGAMERPTPFPGWTLPGVMTVGAAQTLFKESMLLPDESTVIAGTGPLVYLFVNQMLAAGYKPALILDTGATTVAPNNWGHLLRAFTANSRAIFKGRSWLQEIKKAGIPRIPGVTSIKAKGDQQVQSIEYLRGSNHIEIDSGLLLVHDGVIPNNHLTVAAGCQQKWNPVQRYWSPVLDEKGLSSQPGISVVGDSAFIAGGDAAVCSGSVVGWNVAKLLGFINQARCDSESMRDRKSIDKIAILRRFLDNHYRPQDYFQNPTDDKTIVCRCENVSVGEIRKVAALGCMGPNQAKAFTRCGMGPCMGRQCGNTVSQLFANFHGKDVSEIGHYRIRPPVKPLTLGQLANLEMGGDPGRLG